MHNPDNGGLFDCVREFHRTNNERSRRSLTHMHLWSGQVVSAKRPPTDRLGGKDAHFDPDTTSESLLRQSRADWTDSDLRKVAKCCIQDPH